MIGNQRVLALITARGGSKRLPRKNVLPFCGQPLLAWSVQAAKQAEHVDRVILSSDDPEIIAAAREAGCEVPFVRPPELASDEASSVDVALHALDALAMQGDHFQWITLLQPTSPLRTAEDIDGSLRACVQAGAHSALGVTAPERSPFVMFTVNGAGSLDPLCNRGIDLQTARSQDFPPVLAINGAIFLTRVDWLREHRAFYGAGTIPWTMAQQRSINIDTPWDFALGQWMGARLGLNAQGGGA